MQRRDGIAGNPRRHVSRLMTAVMIGILLVALLLGGCGGSSRGVETEPELQWYEQTDPFLAGRSFRKFDGSPEPACVLAAFRYAGEPGVDLSQADLDAFNAGCEGRERP